MTWKEHFWPAEKIVRNGTVRAPPEVEGVDLMIAIAASNVLSSVKRNSKTPVFAISFIALCFASIFFGAGAAFFGAAFLGAAFLGAAGFLVAAFFALGMVPPAAFKESITGYRDARFDTVGGRPIQLVGLAHDLPGNGSGFGLCRLDFAVQAVRSCAPWFRTLNARF
jgi:hypothetical protein